jgi:hypothetical protein
VDESEFGNTDSFVDIVANTLGVVILLTMLTITRVDKHGINVSDDRSSLADLTKKMAAAEKTNASLREQLARDLGRSQESVSLNSLAEAEAVLTQSEELLNDIASQHGEVTSQEEGISAKLSELTAEKAGHESAIELAKKETTELAAEMPGFDLGELDTSSLADMRQGVEGLEAEVQTLSNATAADQAKHEELKKQAVELEAGTKDLEREIASLRVESEILVDVKAPPARRDYKRLPVLLECYARPAKPGDAFLQQYVRFFDAYEKDKESGSLKAPAAGADGGESVLDLEKDDSQFRTFLAGTGEYTKETTCLRFIVRPDAYRAFHRARQIARGAGWEVDWQPIEPGDAPAAGGVGAKKNDGSPRS